MSHASLHPELPAIAARAVLYPELADAERSAAEEGASAGCTRCARALVNAADAGAELALAPLPTAEVIDVSDRLRARVLRAASARRIPRPPPLALAPRIPLDPSASVALHHIGAPGDAERTAEVDALAALDPVEGEATPQLLAELAALIRFPILFVSIVRGDRVGYRAQHGLDPALAALRHIRREMSYCTHTVDTDAPFLVEDAEREPFFRGSRMVRRHGIRAYAGVPLRSARGIVIGTLCALDTEPRRIPPGVIATLQRFTAPVLAILERAR
jgi:GAF domain-containing protein